MKRFSIIRLAVGRLAGSTNGVALIEFALILPLLMLLLMGAVELVRYVQVHQKATLAAHAVADLVSQSPTLTDAQLNDILAASAQMMRPYAANNSNMTVIMTAAEQEDAIDPPNTIWQRSWPNGRAGQSRVSAGEGTPLNVVELLLVERDQVIVIEVLFEFESLLNTIFSADFMPNAEQLYKRAITRPRLGSLGQIG
jgi:Flp pilus assembly protein TadG